MNDRNHKQAVQAQFAPNAEAYVTSSVHANRPDLQRMILLANTYGHEELLDIATGGGHVALAFAPHVHAVIATDLTPAMLEAAKRFIRKQGVTNVGFEIADAEALPYPNASFDIVTCRVAPHHFPNVSRFVREAARVLRSGGIFVLNDTIAPADRELDQFINVIEQLRDQSHVRDYTVDEWHSYCTAAGLTLVQSETFRKTIPFDDWCQRMRVNSGIVDELEQRFQSASPAAQATFAITLEGHKVVQFDLHSVLLAARKP
jgi:ubiquinone/menaquinone biosynthesis C-methylase UbiE